jgi:chemotaxis protein methyltransferase CheR
LTRLACIAFLEWCLPQLGLRWQGYRRVHRLVCRRLGRRVEELGLAGLSEYQTWLAAHPEELARLQGLLRIPVSRFYRDHDVFEAIAGSILPSLSERAMRGAGTIRCWSTGCASGEEPYTLFLIWHFLLARDLPGVQMKIIATDADEGVISRARIACYAPSSLKELPPTWIAQAFRKANGLLCLDCALREKVDFHLQDITQEMPDGPFEIILCRNLVFTYFDEAKQRLVLAGILDRLAEGGFLVLGKHEVLPPGSGELVQIVPNLPTYRRVTGDSSEPLTGPASRRGASRPARNIRLRRT